jgi:hypothetical protein
MYGNYEKQVGRLIKVTGLKAPKGTSKMEVRNQVKDDIKAGGLKQTSHEINRKMPIISTDHFRQVESTMKGVAAFMREKGVKDLEKCSNRMVERYLIEKVEQGVTLKRFENICGHLTKLEGALNKYSNIEKTCKSYSFDRVIDRVKVVAKENLEKDIAARAYERPAEVVSNIGNEKFQLAAAIQHEGGARINEASLITQSRLAGHSIDPVTGKNIGLIKLEGGDCKGGKARYLRLPEKTYDKVASYVEKNGQLHITKSEKQKYRDAIRASAEKDNQKYSGSHGLRHNFARERVAELTGQGKGYMASIAQVSGEMGHERPSITELYLK